MAQLIDRQQCALQAASLCKPVDNDPFDARGRRRFPRCSKRPPQLPSLMGRPPICTCGTIDLWVNEANSSRTTRCSPTGTASAISFTDCSSMPGCGWLSQMAGRNALPRRAPIEAAWEIVEDNAHDHQPLPRGEAVLGYNGDSVLNSVSDIAMMALGFLIARRLPFWWTVAVVIAVGADSAGRYSRQPDPERLDARGHITVALRRLLYQGPMNGPSTSASRMMMTATMQTIESSQHAGATRGSRRLLRRELDLLLARHGFSSPSPASPPSGRAERLRLLVELALLQHDPRDQRDDHQEHPERGEHERPGRDCRPRRRSRARRSRTW